MLLDLCVALVSPSSIGLLPVLQARSMLVVTSLPRAPSIKSLLALRAVEGWLVFIGEVLFEHVPFIVLL